MEVIRFMHRLNIVDSDDARSTVASYLRALTVSGTCPPFAPRAVVQLNEAAVAIHSKAVGQLPRHRLAA